MVFVINKDCVHRHDSDITSCVPTRHQNTDSDGKAETQMKNKARLPNHIIL